MAESNQRYIHLLVDGRIENQDFTRRGRGDQKIRDVERRAHGRKIQAEAVAALTEQDSLRPLGETEELKALGVVITIEGARGYPLKLDSLERQSSHRREPRPKWILLSVTLETAITPESALVWVSDEYRNAFLQLFDDYLNKSTTIDGDNPKNRPLVANMASIRAAVLNDLWQSDGEPPASGLHWWELWLRPTLDSIQLAEQYASAFGLQFKRSHLKFDTRHVVWMQGRLQDLRTLLFTAVPVAEIRRLQIVDTIEDLDVGEQMELTDDLAGRVLPANFDAPAVCLLDTGIRRTHVLISESLDATDMHTVVGIPVGDIDGHGTKMAGLALLGPLDVLLLSSSTIQLRHRLESVKFLPDKNMPPHDPNVYGVVTAEAVALPEINATRRRVFCMAVTSKPDLQGKPSLWSAAIDALAVGTDIGRSSDGVELLGPPDPAAARLIIISAGNVDRNSYIDDYRQNCVLSAIEDPAQAWNALTVGAHTEMTKVPSDPSYFGWRTLARKGDISPHSRTGVIFEKQWPIKPDICMEGGNVITDGANDFHFNHPLLSLRTTKSRDDSAIGFINATSAATAQAARLAALVMATYPSYWPETVRGLLTHSAYWTPLMQDEIITETSKKRRRVLINQFGWGVPDASTVLSSSHQAVTMVVQDEFVPFTGNDYKMRHFRLHRLPWPSEALAELGAEDVELRVTLSYFIEPSAARRGWRSRYANASHGLRFELRLPNETTPEFVRRVNHAAAVEEDGVISTSSRSPNWIVGSDQRNKGSLHQDIWSGHGAELAATGGVVAVHAVSGWWKNNRRRDRIDRPVRYALLVSLRTRAEGVDIYTPIATSLSIPVDAAVIEV